MATYSNLKFITGVAGEDLSDKQSRLVKFDGTSFVTCDEGDSAFGVVFSGANSGGFTTVIYRGSMVVEAGGTFSAGDSLQSDNEGRVVAQTSTNPVVGVALSDGVIGQRVQVQFIGLSGNGASAPAYAELTTPPTVRYNADVSTIVTSNGRVTSISDMQGVADAVESSTGSGPLLLTDATGRKFMRFDGSQALRISSDLAIPSTRRIGVFMVGRLHNANSSADMVYFNFDASGASQNLPYGSLCCGVTSDRVPAIGIPGSVAAFTSNNEKMIPGCNLQVIGDIRRDWPEEGRQNCAVLNRNFAKQNQRTPIGFGASTGGEIGGDSNQGRFSRFDCYELLIYPYGVDAEDSDAVIAEIGEELADFYAIPETTDQLLLEGDSLTQGFVASGSFGGASSGMAMTNPGESLVPATTRVINYAVGGNTVGSVQSRVNASQGYLAYPLAGENKIVMQIGTNNVGAGNDAATIYGQIVDVLNDGAGSGMLVDGFEVVVCTNIARDSATFMGVIDSLRTLLLSPTFLSDCDADTGGTYAGKLEVVRTHLIENGADGTIFETQSDAQDLTYYWTDGLHLTPEATLLMFTGGTEMPRQSVFAPPAAPTPTNAEITSLVADEANDEIDVTLNRAGFVWLGLFDAADGTTASEVVAGTDAVWTSGATELVEGTSAVSVDWSGVPAGTYKLRGVASNAATGTPLSSVVTAADDVVYTPPLFVQPLRALYENNDADASSSQTWDLSSVKSGDRVLFVSGLGSAASDGITSVTIAGQTASLVVSHGSAALYGTNHAVYQIVASSDLTATETVTVTYDTDGRDREVFVVIRTNGVIADSDATGAFSGTASVDVTPTNATNKVLVTATGYNAAIAEPLPMTAGGVSLTAETLEDDDASNTRAAVYIVDNATANSALTVEGDGASRYGFSAIVLQGA